MPTEQEIIHRPFAISYFHFFAIIILCIAIIGVIDGDGMAGERYAERIILPITLGQDEDGETYFLNQPTSGDLNGDGLDDVAFNLGYFHEIGDTSSIIKILINNGDGTYFDGTSNLISGSLEIDIGLFKQIFEDFNGDGQNDIFGSVSGFDNGANIELFEGGQNILLLSGPDGKLHNATATNLPQLKDFTHGTTAGDVDKDGDVDIWVNNLPNDSTQISSYLLINNGQGSFSIAADLGGPGLEIVGLNGRFPGELVGKGAFWSQFIDAENDGDVDLYLGFIPATNRTWLLLNDGTGRFTDAGDNAIPRRNFDGIGQVQSSTISDIDNDGFNDLLLHESPVPAVNECVDASLEKIVIALLISNGDGTFRDETFLRTDQTEDCRNSYDDFYIGDINGDGSVDILIKTRPNNVFFLNNGSGVFTRLSDNFVDIDGSMSLNFVPVDANGDGLTDFIEGNENLDQISLIMRKGDDSSGGGDDGDDGDDGGGGGGGVCFIGTLRY